LSVDAKTAPLYCPYVIRWSATLRRRLIGAGTVSVVIVSAPVLASGYSAVAYAEACPDSPVLREDFRCEDPGVSNVDIPEGSTSVDVTAVGGGGGAGNTGAPGGGGAEVTAQLTTQGIDKLLVTVASGGMGRLDGGETAGGTSGGGVVVGEYGSFGDAADSDSGRPTGGGMSAVTVGDEQEPGTPMDVEDVLVVAGGGGGSAKTKPGGVIKRAGGSAGRSGGAGGDGKGASNSQAKGGAAFEEDGQIIGKGGAGGDGKFLDGSEGRDFDGTEWGASVEGPGSTGGAGFGGGGGGDELVFASAAAGGSFVKSAALANPNVVATFAPHDNGGKAESMFGKTGGDGFVTLFFRAAPTLSPGEDPSVDSTSATVMATLNPRGIETTEAFVEYATELSEVEAGNGSKASFNTDSFSDEQNHSVSIELGNLEAGTTFYYRVVATNADGTTRTSIRSFTTQLPSTGESGSPSQSMDAPGSDQDFDRATSQPIAETHGDSATKSNQPVGANAGGPRRLVDGVWMVDPQRAVNTSARALMKPLGSRIGESLTLTVEKSTPLKLIVRRGLEPNSAHAVFVKRLGAKYSRVVEVSTDASGEVQLPVLEYQSLGTYVMALRDGDATKYLKLRVRSK